MSKQSLPHPPSLRLSPSTPLACYSLQMVREKAIASHSHAVVLHIALLELSSLSQASHGVFNTRWRLWVVTEPRRKDSKQFIDTSCQFGLLGNLGRSQSDQLSLLIARR